MINDNLQPVKPFFPETEKERQDFELWKGITTAVHSCGYYGDDVTAKSIDVLKQLGRYDMLPPCERGDEKEKLNDQDINLILALILLGGFNDEHDK